MTQCTVGTQRLREQRAPRGWLGGWPGFTFVMGERMVGVDGPMDLRDCPGRRSRPQRRQGAKRSCSLNSRTAARRTTPDTPSTMPATNPLANVNMRITQGEKKEKHGKVYVWLFADPSPRYGSAARARTSGRASWRYVKARRMKDFAGSDRTGRDGNVTSRALSMVPSSKSRA